MRVYLQEGKIDFNFTQNKEDFAVDEIALKHFGQKGKYLVFRVQKYNLSTWDMIEIFAQYLALPASAFGYAGLKDKYATTLQFISIGAKYERELQKFSHPQIKIIATYRDSKPLKMGELQGNRFRLHLYNITPIKAGQIEKKMRKIMKNGVANYFGYQRFGSQGDSIKQAKELVATNLHIQDPKVRNFLVSVYQSYLFNKWLKKRIAMSKDGVYMPLVGDVYKDENNRFVTPKSIPQKDIQNGRLVPTGLLAGRDVFLARADARVVESEFDEYIQTQGYRREALVFPKEYKQKFYKQNNMLALSFILPKGSYATVVLEALAGREFTKDELIKPYL